VSKNDKYIAYIPRIADETKSNSQVYSKGKTFVLLFNL